MKRRTALLGLLSAASGAASAGSSLATIGKVPMYLEPDIGLFGRRFRVQNPGNPDNFIRYGNDAVRFALRPGDRMGETERSEIYCTDNFRTRFAAKFEFNVEEGARNTADWLLLGQLWQRNMSSMGSPPVAFELAGEEFRIVGRSGPEDYMRLFADPRFERDRWYLMQVSAHFDKQNGALDVRRDGVHIVSYRGPLGYPDAIEGRWKIGLYRSPARQAIAARYRRMRLS